MKYRNKSYKTFLVFSLLTFIIFSCGNSPKSTSDQYPKPWREPNNEEFIEIGRSLVKNQIKNCGEYYIRPSSEHNHEYLVGCSIDGESWSYYVVWTSVQEVMGPYSDTAIEKPQRY